MNETNDFYLLWNATAAEQIKMARESRSKFIANERWMVRERVPPGDIFTYITLIRDPLDRCVCAGTHGIHDAHMH